MAHVSVVTYSIATYSCQFLYLEIKGGPDYLIAALSRVGGDVCAAWGVGGGSLGQVPDTGLVLNRSRVVKKTSFTKEKIGSMQIETSLHSIKGVMLSPWCVTELTHSPVLLPGSAMSTKEVHRWE